MSAIDEDGPVEGCACEDCEDERDFAALAVQLSTLDAGGVGAALALLMFALGLGLAGLMVWLATWHRWVGLAGALLVVAGLGLGADRLRWWAARRGEIRRTDALTEEVRARPPLMPRQRDTWSDEPFDPWGWER